MDIKNEEQLDRAVRMFEARVEEERKHIREVDDKLAAQLTSILIAGSIGAIIASVTFLKDIAPAPVLGSLLYLRIAWGFLLVASVLGIGSLVVNRVAARHFRDLLYARLQRQECAKLETLCRRWNAGTRWLQGLGMGLLALGAALLVWFANVNLPAEGEPSEGNRSESVTSTG